MMKQETSLLNKVSISIKPCNIIPNTTVRNILCHTATDYIILGAGVLKCLVIEGIGDDKANSNCHHYLMLIYSTLVSFSEITDAKILSKK